MFTDVKDDKKQGKRKDPYDLPSSLLADYNDISLSIMDVDDMTNSTSSSSPMGDTIETIA